MEKQTPSDAIRLLKDLNEKVVMLTQTVELALDKGLVDGIISGNMRDQLKEVKKFYH